MTNTEVYWTEAKKQRVVDYISGLIFGYGFGLVMGAYLL